MRSLSLFLVSFLIFNIFFVSVQASSYSFPKGYAKDAHGRTLVYRAKPNWWLIPSGSLLTSVGGLITYGAYHEPNPRIHLSGSWKLGDIWPDLHKVLSNIQMRIPLNNISGAPAKVIKCGLGAGVTLSGAALLYSYFSNYIKLYTPLIVIDSEGLHYEGKDKIVWKDVKSIRVVRDTSFNWHNNTGNIKETYALEIVDTFGMLLIAESDIAITVDALYGLIKQYHKRWW
jgi:hypothetical protein